MDLREGVVIIETRHAILLQRRNKRAMGNIGIIALNQASETIAHTHVKLILRRPRLLGIEIADKILIERVLLRKE